MAETTPTGIPLSVATPKAKRSSWRTIILAGIVVLVLVGGILLAVISRAYQNDAVGSSADPYPTTNDPTDPVTDHMSQDHQKNQIPTQPQNQPQTPTTQPPSATTSDAQNAAQTQPPAQAVATSPAQPSRAELAWSEEYKATTTPLADYGTQQGQMPQANMPAYPTMPGEAGGSLLQGLPGSAEQPTNKQTAPALASSDDPIPFRRIPAPSEFMLPPGTWIHAKLGQRAVSELAGDLHATIDQNVYDNRGRIMIPQTTTLIGSYGGRVAYGQGRLLQVWTLLVFPDNSTIRLNDLSATDETGAAGLKDRVDNHVGRLIRDAAITTVFAAGIAVTQRQPATILAAPSVGQAIGQSVGQSIGELGSQATRLNLNREPTIEIRPGSEFQVMVNRPMIFDGPYRPMKPGQSK